MTQRLHAGHWILIAGCCALPAILAPGTIRAAERVVKPGYANVLIRDVPHVQQKPDFCGEACAEMWIRKLGHKVDQDDVFDLSGVDAVLGRGCRTPELVRALSRLGFETGDVYHAFPSAKAAKHLGELWKALHADLMKDIPSIICMRTGDGRDATEHFRLVLGYDAKTDEVIYHEPAQQGAPYQRMKRDRFTTLWPLKYRKDLWTVVRLRLKTEGVRAIPPVEGHRSADYAQHIRAVRKRLPHRGFSLVLQRPFVVIGDEPLATVRMRAEQTVKWATDRLKAQYFEKDPDAIIDVWLFKDKDSYRKHALALFDDRPSTPFGYFSDQHNALVMNIATGGGTLVHEMVHPFMAANFPACPAWFNEGLASLYEQSGSKGNRIWGRTNWRLAGLQKGIRAGRVPSFKELTHSSDFAFYQEDEGTNYAQARYLCYYLQEKGLLETYYRTFRKNAGSDPTGFTTLQGVLDSTDMVAFRKRWERYVLKLRFP